LQTSFIPAITGGIAINQEKRKLLTLPTKLGGLGIPVFSEIPDTEYENSKIITENLCRIIVNQVRQCNRDPGINLKKTRIKKNIREKSQQVLDELKCNLDREHPTSTGAFSRDRRYIVVINFASTRRRVPLR